MTVTASVPAEAQIAAEYWEKGPHGAAILIAEKCAACGMCYLPKVMVCAECGGKDFVHHCLPDTGRLYVHTIIHAAPPGYPSPYAVGYVDFDGGVRVFGHVRLDSMIAPEPDCAVAIETAELFEKPSGQKVVGYRFVPVAKSGSA